MWISCSRQLEIAAGNRGASLIILQGEIYIAGPEDAANIAERFFLRVRKGEKRKARTIRNKPPNILAPRLVHFQASAIQN
jgi:hypothetical protein